MQDYDSPRRQATPLRRYRTGNLPAWAPRRRRSLPFNIERSRTREGCRIHSSGSSRESGGACGAAAARGAARTRGNQAWAGGRRSRATLMPQTKALATPTPARRSGTRTIARRPRTPRNSPAPSRPRSPMPLRRRRSTRCSAGVRLARRARRPGRASYVLPRVLAAGVRGRGSRECGALTSCRDLSNLNCSRQREMSTTKGR